LGVQAVGERRRTTVRKVDPEDVGQLPTEESVVLFDRRQAPRMSITGHPALGVRLDHEFFGAFRVAPRGDDVVCAPRQLPDWLWQRFLVGQVLPLASVMRGFEPFHASAVRIRGRAVLCAGASGAGKSSVALQLLDRGAGLLADDVAAVSVEQGEPVVEPGVALISADAQELELLRDDGPVSRWARLGSFDGEVRLVHPEPVAGPTQIAAVFVLTRSAGPPGIRIGPPDGPLAKTMLGATFNAYYQNAERAFRHLEVSAALAARASVQQVHSGPGVTATATAAAIERRLERLD